MTIESDSARQVIDDLRIYLRQFGLDLGSDLPTPEEVRDRVLFCLEEYRRLSAQQRGNYSYITCGTVTPTTGVFVGTPAFGISSVKPYGT